MSRSEAHLIPKAGAEKTARQHKGGTRRRREQPLYRSVVTPRWHWRRRKGRCKRANMEIRGWEWLEGADGEQRKSERCAGKGGETEREGRNGTKTSNKKNRSESSEVRPPGGIERRWCVGGAQLGQSEGGRLAGTSERGWLGGLAWCRARRFRSQS